MRRNELTHYASPYYDPVKAHEYYMQHRQLKGRTSTSGLNDKGKEAARYVKEQIDNERKTKIKASQDKQKSDLQKKREYYKQVRQQQNEQVKTEISSLRDVLKEMTPREKRIYRNKITIEIYKLRRQNQSAMQEIQNELSIQLTGITERGNSEREGLKSNYEQRYISELDKIRATAEFQAPPKKTKKK